MDRAAFRERVFARDGGLCVFCKAPAVDAHHLLERRLWRASDEAGGYLVDNGISVCGVCHVICEQTLYSVEEGRAAAGITNVVVPEHLYADQPYDKWGNPILEDGRRSPGELFTDPSVQKILREGAQLETFVPYMKYPRTYHLPWSFPNKDDRSLTKSEVEEAFDGREVVITEKMDGECTSIYSDYLHARSITGESHPSQSWVRSFAARWQYELPYGVRVCGENVYARHSLAYEDLPTYFFGFSIWEWDRCLSWDQTLEWFAILGVEPVPVIYQGQWSYQAARRLADELDPTRCEGYVVRLRGSFTYRAFSRSVAKYVRKDHLRTPERWSRAFIPNRLAKRAE